MRQTEIIYYCETSSTKFSSIEKKSKIGSKRESKPEKTRQIKQAVSRRQSVSVGMLVSNIEKQSLRLACSKLCVYELSSLALRLSYEFFNEQSGAEKDMLLRSDDRAPSLNELILV